MKASILLCLVMSGYATSSHAQLNSNPIMQKFDHAFERVKSLASRSIPAQAGVILLTGDSAGSVADHYQNLFKQMMRFVVMQSESFPSAPAINEAETNSFSDKGAQLPKTKTATDTSDNYLAFGNGNRGYYASSYLNDDVMMPVLQRMVPIARVRFLNREKMGLSNQWSDWQSFFKTNSHPEGDARIAMLALIDSLGWCRDVLPSKKDAILSKIFPSQNLGSSDSRYDVSFLKNAKFGIDLSGSSETIGSSWGRAYKTIAGATLATGLYEYGYQADEIRWAVRIASLAYEASDLLNDHLGRKNKSIEQERDNAAYSKYDPEYTIFLQLVRDLLTKQPQLASQLVQGFTEIDLVSRFNPFEFIDFNDDLQLTVLLLSFRNSSPKTFLNYFGTSLRSLPNGKILLSLIDSGVNDVASMIAGTNFSTEKLKGYAPRFGKSKPSYLGTLKKVSEWTKFE